MPLKKFEAYNEIYTLNGESIDIMAGKIEDFLYSLDMERANVLGIRLTIEEALLRWHDYFCREGEDVKVRFNIGRVLLRPMISIELKGESVDPLSVEDPENELGDWVGNVMGNIGLTPRYSYQKGINTLTLRLNRRHVNPGVGLLLSIFIGLFAGFAGKAALSEETMKLITKVFFTPVQDVFIKLLEATAGPVIFFTVLTAICGVGSAALMNKSGKRLITRFLVMSSVMTLIFTVLGVFLYKLDVMGSILTGTSFSSVFEFFLGIVPENIVSPFASTDSPQLILLAIIIGNALLILGSQGDRLVKIANQANSVGLLVAEWISRLIPYFVAILLAFRVMDGTIVRFKGIWLPLLLFHVYSVVFMAIVAFITSRKMKVSMTNIWKKVAPSFMIALKNASVDAAFGENRSCCERKLGIDGKLADYGLPLGLVIYMPVSTVSLMVSTLYAVQCYHMTISALWLLMAMILVVALQAASPPVSGVDSLAYAAIFTKLGIPFEALIMAIVCDTIFCFLSSAGNQFMLQLELIGEADRLNMMNREKLEK